MQDSVKAAKPLLIWPDRLRNLAMLMVIAIHLAAPISQQNTSYDTFYWWSGNFWDALSRPAVPLFVMLSGFLLLSKDYPLADFLKRRFSRVVVPALVWMAIYSFYNYQSHGVPDNFTSALKGIVNGPVHYHLWYVYLIIGLYLTYPVLRPWIKQASERDFLYFFAVCILGTWVYKTCVTFGGFKVGIYFEFFTNQAGHFVLGYYLGNKLLREQATGAETGIKPWSISRKQVLWLAFGLLVAGTAVTATGNWWFSKAQGHYFPYFYDYLTPNVGIAAIGWFLLVLHTWNSRPLLDIEKAFAAAGFGVYLFHVFAIDWWNVVGYYQARCYPIVCVPMMIVMVAAFSYIPIAILRSIPGGDRIS